MASGKLSAASLAAGVDTLIYSVPTGKTATLNINVVNRGSSTTVRIAIGTGAAPADTDYIEYGTALPPSGVIERTGLVCSAGEKIWCQSSAGNASVRVHGFED